METRQITTWNIGYNQQPITVTKTAIIGTDRVVYEAWEDDAAGNHSVTIMTIDGRRMGKVATRSLPPELDALPARSQERWDAVMAFHASLYTEAYAAICAAYPPPIRTVFLADGTPNPERRKSA